VFILVLLVGVRECLELNGSQVRRWTCPLEQQLVRLVPPALPMGRWSRLATQAPGAFHETLLVECLVQEHWCEEGTSRKDRTPCVPAAGVVTRLA
jgi:hypothetical protein